jgi:hypothetical protein
MTGVGAGAGASSPLPRPPAAGARAAAQSSYSVEFTMKDIVLPVLSASASAQELNEWFLTLEHNIKAAGANDAFESTDTDSPAMWVAMLRLRAGLDTSLQQRFNEYTTCGDLYAALLAGLQKASLPRQTVLLQRLCSLSCEGMTLLKFIDHCTSMRTELIAAQLFDEKTVEKLLSTYFLTLLKNTWLEHWVMGVYSKVTDLPPSLSALRVDLHKLYPEKMSSQLSIVPRAHQVSSSASAACHPQLPKEYCCYCHQMHGRLRKHSVTDCFSLRNKLAAQPLHVLPGSDISAPVPQPPAPGRWFGRGRGRGRGHGRGSSSRQAHAVTVPPVPQPVPYTMPAGMPMAYPSPVQYVVPVSPATAPPGRSTATPTSSCYAIGLASEYNAFAACH